MPGDERTLQTGLGAGPESSPAGSPGDDEVAAALASGRLEVLGLLPGASNATFLGRVVDASGTAIPCVYKPRRGETPLWDFPDGTLCRREVAAFVVARALGWPNVPPTVLRGGPGGIGSVQRFVETRPGEHAFTIAETRIDELRPIAAFDLVVNNADRKAGHCLLGVDGRIYVVDHGVCFAEEPKLRTVIWAFAEEPLPAALAGDLARLAAAMDGPLGDELGALLEEGEVAATRRRLDELLASGTFPEPGPGRPYPWPPI